MVSEIEKEWPREQSAAVYEGLLLIHDAQTLSGKQVQSKSAGAESPSSDFVTYVSCYKGAASVVWVLTFRSSFFFFFFLDRGTDFIITECLPLSLPLSLQLRTCKIAAGLLITGTLTKEQQDFLFHIGLALQLLDDLQDVIEDANNNQHTIFSSRYLKGELLDEPVIQLLHFVHDDILL